MSNYITFDFNAGKCEKEDIEWARIWCENTADPLPRIALVGDSITEGYFPYVKKALEEMAKVDYLATSYSVKSPMYQAIVLNFIKDSDYKAVHFNYGLHAGGVAPDEYEKECRRLIDEIKKTNRIAVATTTKVTENDLVTESATWAPIVSARNVAITKIAREENLPLDDLYSVCRDFEPKMRCPDGVHFAPEGYEILSRSVAECVKKLLD